MLEIKVTVEIPGLPESVNALAQAIAGKAIPTQSCDVAKPVEVKAPEAAQTANYTAAPAPAAAPAAVAPAAAPAPAATPAPAPAAAPAAAPAPAAPTITIEKISLAGAALASAGRMGDLMAIVAKHGVQALTQLKPEQYEAVAADLRALGAQI